MEIVNADGKLEHKARTGNHEHFYKLSKEIVDQPQASWMLWLTTATDLFHCVRRMHNKSIIMIARFLVGQGIAFSTRIRIPSTKKFARVPPAFRHPDYQQFIFVRLGLIEHTLFTWADYLCYERRRISILNKPHCRAALLMGGIIWRLAYDHLSVDSALSGPSNNVLVYGQGSRIEEYWDDGMTADELDIICGLYICHTGEFYSLHDDVNIKFGYNFRPW